MNRRKLLLGMLATTGLITSGAAYWHHRWKYIVIHHSAGNYGNIEFLQRVHRERQAKDPIDAIPYHYVIGNGNGLVEGEVVSDWRNEYGIWGAHVSARNSDHNLRGIGICLIGNFERKNVSDIQYNALVKLTKKLMREHNILAQNVSGHRFVKGERTKCPGKMFPMEKFRKDIA
jgi:N-acetyl-anhydromuramyl-L-alanine amidase AmpD